MPRPFRRGQHHRGPAPRRHGAGQGFAGHVEEGLAVRAIAVALAWQMPGAADAEAHLAAKSTLLARRQVGHGMVQAGGDQFGPCKVGLGEEDGKPLLTEAGKEVGGAQQRLVEGPGHEAQAAYHLLPAILVKEAGRAVDLEEQEAERGRVAPGLTPFFGKIFDKIALAEQPGVVVKGREFGQLRLQNLDLEGPLIELAAQAAHLEEQRQAPLQKRWRERWRENIEQVWRQMVFPRDSAGGADMEQGQAAALAGPQEVRQARVAFAVSALDNDDLHLAVQQCCGLGGIGAT